MSRPTAGTWGSPVATGTWPNTDQEQTATFAARSARYVRLRVLSEIRGNPWASAAELNVGVAPRLPQAGSTVRSVDSEETGVYNGRGSNVLDGNTATIWHSHYSTVDPDPPPPHEIQLDLGRAANVTCLYYVPRRDSANGRIGRYEAYLSTDGTTWGTPVATGTWPNSSAEQTVCFPGRTARYLRLRALSEVNGNPWSSAAELIIGGQ